MLFHSEIKFTQNFLKKCNIQSLIITQNNIIDSKIDIGLRAMFGKKTQYLDTFVNYFDKAEKNTVYKFKDEYKCNFLYMLLPHTDERSIFCIGPFLCEEVTREQILEWAEKCGLNQNDIKQLELYYNNLPHIDADSFVFSVIDTFTETIFGKNSYSAIDLNRSESFEPSFTSSNDSDDNNNLIKMQIMEARYSFENDLMQAVALGQEHKAELILSGISKFSFEIRLSDPVRNVKNYCIVMNTLLRKAAENGGVHPVYLDDTKLLFMQFTV